MKRPREFSSQKVCVGYRYVAPKKGLQMGGFGGDPRNAIPQFIDNGEVAVPAAIAEAFGNRVDLVISTFEVAAVQTADHWNDQVVEILGRGLFRVIATERVMQDTFNVGDPINLALQNLTPNSLG